MDRILQHQYFHHRVIKMRTNAVEAETYVILANGQRESEMAEGQATDSDSAVADVPVREHVYLKFAVVVVGSVVGVLVDEHGRFGGTKVCGALMMDSRILMSPLVAPVLGPALEQQIDVVEDNSCLVLLARLHRRFRLDPHQQSLLLMTDVVVSPYAVVGMMLVVDPAVRSFRRRSRLAEFDRYREGRRYHRRRLADRIRAVVLVLVDLQHRDQIFKLKRTCMLMNLGDSYLDL
jgi:hypothetical protein